MTRAGAALVRTITSLWIDERIGTVPPIHTTGEPRIGLVPE